MNLPRSTRHLIPAFLLIAAGCKAPPATVRIIGLWPEEPPLCYKAVLNQPPLYICPTVKSVQPTFRWEAFPRPADLAAEPNTNGPLHRITRVTYDLRIWRFIYGAPPGILYERTALPEPSHHVETPLPRNTYLHWTIRARFEYDHKTRVTEWSRLIPPQPPYVTQVTNQLGAIEPDGRYFYFKTP